MMNEPSFRAALVGETESAEMSPVRDQIARHLGSWEVREFRGLPDLLAEGTSAGYFPDLVLVCQRWRDEYSANAVREGLSLFPVARWICVYGAWCESEGRHGSRWPMAVRVSLRALETRLATEAAVVRGDIPALALTAARDEVFEFDTQERGFPKHIGAEIPLAIVSPDRELRGWLTDLFSQPGFTIVPDSGAEDSAKILIVDLDPWTCATPVLLQELRRQHPSAKLLGLMGLPSPETTRRFRNEGGEDVLSKLAPSAQILDRIGELA